MRRFINLAGRNAWVFLGLLVAGTGHAVAGDAGGVASPAPAIRFAPYLPRYTPPPANPVPVVTADVRNAVPVSKELPGVPATHVPPASTDAVAPAASLSPSESVASFRLEAGAPLESQLAAWAKQAGWTLLWNIEPGWVVPGAADFGTDFETAVTKAIEALAANGADVRADGYRENHVFVVHEAGNQ